MRSIAIIIAVLSVAGCDDRSSSTAQAPPVTPMATSAPAGMNKYPYLAADGGPHMLLPAEAASAWKGVSSMAAVTNPKSDYGRAGAATASAQMGVIPVGSTTALVFADPEHFIVAVGVERRVYVNQIHARRREFLQLLQAITTIDDAGVEKR
jgi:hypothetical protein